MADMASPNVTLTKSGNDGHILLWSVVRSLNSLFSVLQLVWSKATLLTIVSQCNHRLNLSPDLLRLPSPQRRLQLRQTAILSLDVRRGVLRHHLLLPLRLTALLPPPRRHSTLRHLRIP